MSGLRALAAGVSLALFAALPAARAQSAPSLADVPYGASAQQCLDVYLPVHRAATAAPIIVMVHGGAWMVGDKRGRGVVANKLAHWGGEGFIFVSVNNRLYPEAVPLAQAEDVARALATVQAKAAAWGGDADRIVLMGHSAGAHLVALLSAAPDLAAQFGVRPWRGTVVLDSAALDLVGLMQSRHAGFYDRVFGADIAEWRAMSPTARLRAGAEPMLLVCSTLRRDDSCGQSQRFAARVQQAGGRAEVLEQALDHGHVNASLGEAGSYTSAVDAFIASLGIAAPAPS